MKLAVTIWQLDGFIMRQPRGKDAEELKTILRIVLLLGPIDLSNDREHGLAHIY